MVVKKILFIFSLLFVIFQAQASVDVNISSSSTNGEAIVLSFVIIDANSIEVEKSPQNNGEWVVNGPIQSKSVEATLINGQLTQKSTVEVSFEFTPLKIGSFQLPLTSLRVDNKIYTSPTKTILVKSLSAKNKPNQKKSFGFPGFPFDEDFDIPLSPITPNISENQKLEVFVLGQPSKTTVYTGELITLPFYLYANRNVFKNIEFAGFPTFKDFIKEELNLPKTWRSERTAYRNQNYWRSEIIRFALFPIKEGELYIDPLKMRVEIDDGAFGFFNLNPDDANEEKTLLKSSGTLPVTVKALPPAPSGFNSTDIAVGEYSIEMIPPSGPIIQNEAFSLKIKISGIGNLKGIEEPKVIVPESFQRSKVNTTYEFNQNAEGYKEFEYLFVPRKSGKFLLEENTWLHFSPSQEKYVTSKTQAIELYVEASSKKTSTAVTVSENDTIFGGDQDFKNIHDSLPLGLWSIPLFSYALAAFLLVQRKKHEKEEALRNNTPWKIIERQISNLGNTNSFQYLQLIEAWIITRFSFLFKDEVAFEEICRLLRNKSADKAGPKIQRLEDRFKLIETLRFNGSRNGISQEASKISFDEIKKLTEEVCLAYSTSESSETAEDADDFD